MLSKRLVRLLIRGSFSITSRCLSRSLTLVAGQSLVWPVSALRLLSWVQVCCTSQGESLYAIHGYEKFTIDDLHKVMQYTLDDLHIPGLRATSHSLRYGGATMLAAAGFPVYTIAMYGGWAPDSKSLRFYTKASEQMVGLVSAHMARMASEDSSKFFVNDLLIIAKTR